MSVARAAICERLEATRRAICDFKLQDLALVPENASHNASVRIIRNGLAVQCFTILEDFAKDRTKEALTEVSSSPVVFNYLPEGLQDATTLEAIRAIVVQLRLKERADRIPYAQQYSAMIASTDTPPLQLADIAFFHTGSNIGKDHFRDALAAFAVDKPWLQLSGLSSRLGLSGMSAENVFISLAQRRHQAAHNASAAVSEADLAQSITDAFGLAIGFDILLSKATSRIIRLTGRQAPAYRAVKDHSSIPLRFIRARAKGFAESREGSSRSTRIQATMAALLPDALSRARKEDGAVVIFDAAGSVTEWQL